MKALIIIVLTLAIFGTGGYFAWELFVKPEQELKKEKMAPATPVPPDPTLPEFQKCVAIRKSGKLPQAREALLAFIDQYPQSTKLDEARTMLGEINTAMFLSPLPLPDKQVYIVKPGDVINRVATKMQTTSELIMRSNNLTGTMLRIGQKVMVSQGDFSLVINRKQQRVVLLNNGKFFAQYPVLSWPPSFARKPGAPPPPKAVGKVSDKVAWYNGNRITLYEKPYTEVTYWVQINLPGCTLHSEPETSKAEKPHNGGIQLSRKALSDLAAIMRKGDAVTLE